MRRSAGPKLSTPLAIFARQTNVIAKPRDKILRLYRFASLLPSLPLPSPLRRHLQPRAENAEAGVLVWLLSARQECGRRCVS